MSQLQEAKEDIGNLAGTIYNALVEFEMKYKDLHINELVVHYTQTIGSAKPTITNIELHVSVI